MRGPFPPVPLVMLVSNHPNTTYPTLPCTSYGIGLPPWPLPPLSRRPQRPAIIVAMTLSGGSSCSSAHEVQAFVATFTLSVDTRFISNNASSVTNVTALAPHTCIDDWIDPGPTAWYRLVGPFTKAPLFLSTCDPTSSLDTNVAVLTGECDALSMLSCSGDTFPPDKRRCQRGYSELSLDPADLSPAYVYLAVSGWGESKGRVALTGSFSSTPPPLPPPQSPPPPLLPPSPPPPPLSPSPSAPVWSMPPTGVLVLDGGSGNFPPQSCVTNESTTAFGGEVIAAQCCTASGVCKRKTSSSNNDCVGGMYPNVRPMTIAETYQSCVSQGLQLCQKNCANAGELCSRSKPGLAWTRAPSVDV